MTGGGGKIPFSPPAGALALCSLALLAGTVAHCGSGEARRPNVLLISLDTYRADRMGCYGAERDTTPHLDRLAGEGVLYERAFSTSAWTLPSHVSMLSCTSHAGASVFTKKDAIPDHVPMLAESFSRAGYRTAAYVDSVPRGFVGGERGFSRGFDEYRHAPHRRGLTFRYDMAVTVDEALSWLRRRDGGRPFLLFLHTKSAHAVPARHGSQDKRHLPYDQPPPYRFRFREEADLQFSWNDREEGRGVKYLRRMNLGLLRGERTRESFPRERIEELRDLYDGGIAYVDRQLGRLFREMKNLSLWEDTIVVVTADHGEAFLDHNLLLHVELYDEVLRVPLLVKVPDTGAAERIGDNVSLEDVAPTLLSLAGIAPPEGATGDPLPLKPGEPPPRLLFAETSGHDLYRGSAVRSGDWVLLRFRFQEHEEDRQLLYNLRQDAAQRHPLSDPMREDRLSSLLDELLVTAYGTRGEEFDLDRATEVHLRSLGYIQ